MKEDHKFAESTIQATIWLMCYKPEVLKEWFDERHPSDVLREIAAKRISPEKRKELSMCEHGEREEFCIRCGK
jgi:hypothetical protein